MPSATQQPFKNKLLAILPARDIETFIPALSPLHLDVNRILHRAGEPIDVVYFLEEGVCSAVVSMEDGHTVGVAVIGHEGFVGIPALVGEGYSSNRTFMQTSGRGFSVKVGAFLERFQGSQEFRMALLRSAQGHLAQMSQTAACNRVHELKQRLARWLLMLHDRVQSDRIDITQEGLATMLGARRTTITAAAGSLQREGMIEYSRGHVMVHNRRALMECACECYAVVHDQYVRLGLTVSSPPLHIK